MSILLPPEVEITLDGQPVTLRCTLEAAIGINSYFQGLAIAHQRVLSMDIDACAVIIRHGAGIDAKGARDLPRQIHQRGVAKFTGPLAKFMVLLMSGGRDAKDDEPGEAAPAGEGAG